MGMRRERMTQANSSAHRKQPRMTASDQIMPLLKTLAATPASIALTIEADEPASPEATPRKLSSARRASAKPMEITMD